MWSQNDAKMYKVANFTNSDSEPFGLTIKGKGKHIYAHNKVMDTLNRLQKDKATTFGAVKLTITDKVKTNAIFNAKITLTAGEDFEGQVEIKIHKPSDKRCKATIDIRKLSGSDFEAFEKAKTVVIDMLDDFMNGESVSKVLTKAKGKAKPYCPIVKQPSLSTKLLACTKCDFKVKSVVVLKNHISKNHTQKKCSCEICGFESSIEDMQDHMKEFHIVHHNIIKQNKRKNVTFACDKCGVTVDTNKKLKTHIEHQHPEPSEISSSPEPSPPRKKPVIQVQVEEEKEEIMDTEEVGKIEENDLKKETYKDELIKTQAKQLEEQSKEISEMKKKY